MGDIIENETFEYGGNRGNVNDVILQETNSMPGSFAESSGANNMYGMNPDVYDNTSQKSTEDVDVNVQLIEE